MVWNIAVWLCSNGRLPSRPLEQGPCGYVPFFVNLPRIPACLVFLVFLSVCLVFMSGISASYACLFFNYLATGFGLKQTSSAPKPPLPRLLPAMDDTPRGGRQNGEATWRQGDWQAGWQSASRSRGGWNEGRSRREDDGQAGRQDEEATWRQGDWQAGWHDASRSRGWRNEGRSRRDDDGQAGGVSCHILPIPTISYFP